MPFLSGSSLASTRKHFLHSHGLTDLTHVTRTTETQDANTRLVSPAPPRPCDFRVLPRRRSTSGSEVTGKMSSGGSFERLRRRASVWPRLSGTLRAEEPKTRGWGGGTVGAGSVRSWDGDDPRPHGTPGRRAPRGRFMPPTGLEPPRMNRKKGDKGFESPRPYKL
jgi:hypothetical protein